jgi:fatty-acyl-CoA synthase
VGLERTTYGEWAERTRRLGGVLDNLGISADGRVATFAWNTARHLELYFAAPCTGRVLHTLNIRLFPEQLTYIVNHADDEVIFVDRSLLGLLAPLLPTFERLKHLVLMDDGKGDIPADLAGHELLDYEELLAAADPSSSASTTSTAPRACATRAVRPATRRVSSTATAARSCTRWGR